MYLPMISGYELGQFLRILLWIFVPMVILSMLVTTWLHYRRRRRDPGELLLSLGGLGDDDIFMPVRVTAKMAGGSGGEEEAGDEAGDEGAEYKETVYKGILFMKEKYEQYRELSDRRYERLKEELARAEKKYDDLMASRGAVGVGDQRTVGSTERAAPVTEMERDSLRDLLAERNQQITFLQGQLDQRIKDFHMVEHEGRGARGQIQELEEQAAEYRQKIEELVDRLRNNSQLLQNIYQELDRSLRATDTEA